MRFSRRRFVLFVTINLILLAVAHLPFAEPDAVAASIPGQSSSFISRQYAEAALVVCPADMRFGLTIQCGLTTATEHHTYTFTAAQGDVVKARIRVTAGDLDPSIHLTNSENEQLCTAFTSDTLAEITSCLLQATGSYTLTVDDTYQAHVGDYLLYAQLLNRPDNAQALRFGQPLTGTLDFPSQFKTYAFTTTVAGANVKLTMTRDSGTLYPRIRIYSPTGSQLCNALTSSDTAAIDTCSLPKSGTYTVLADDTNISRLGSYTLALTCLNEACAAAQVRVPLILARK